MTAVLSAVARVVLGAVLILAGFAAMLWADFGPQDWVVVWLLAMFAVVAGATLAWSALSPREREPGQAIERHARQAVPRHRKGDA